MMSGACPEFSFTEEDIKKFVEGVKVLAKRPFMLCLMIIREYKSLRIDK
jgi:hypothetical protein